MVVVVVSKVVDMMSWVEKNHYHSYYYLGGMAKSSFVPCKAFVQ
jgi:hypothetical protein